MTSKVILNRLSFNGFQKKSKGGGKLEKSQFMKQSDDVNIFSGKK